MGEQQMRAAAVRSGETGALRRTRRGARPCGLCGEVAPRLMRIKAQEGGAWFIACPICAARVCEDNPYFAYGGRISPRPSRASA